MAKAIWICESASLPQVGFTSFRHLEEAVRITYSACNVSKITMREVAGDRLEAPVDARPVTRELHLERRPICGKSNLAVYMHDGQFWLIAKD